jgi:hypothetical protein
MFFENYGIIRQLELVVRSLLDARQQLLLLWRQLQLVPMICRHLRAIQAILKDQIVASSIL